ncbi:MAG TPA: hypothetical protein VJ692_07230 [Nitrospiraceae bacterium]|nr:hypothetical protein [Nitrospiraceae bacterium]
MIPHPHTSHRRPVPGSVRTPSPEFSFGTIPFDYAAKFRLTGRPGNIVQDVITVSPDGVFVAVAISYGLEEDRARALHLNMGRGATVVPGDIKLSAIPVPALIEGIRVNPRFDSQVFEKESTNGFTEPGRPVDFLPEKVTAEGADQIFQRIKPRREISFLFSLVDTGSGRELQDEPQYSLASLGKSDGERPFRPLAQPLSFSPRSTIRVQIEERTPDTQGTLFIVLVGYQVLSGSACSEPMAQSFARAAMTGMTIPQTDQRGLIPFDYVTKFTLIGRPGNRLEDEVTINAEGGFAATAIGYGLCVEDESVDIHINKAEIALSDLALRDISLTAVADGFRIRPEYVRLILGGGGGLKKVKRAIAQEALERLNRVEDVSFRYTIYDTGVGRIWQNQPIHNIAGLGIANGQRPFKRLAWPRVFEPRSTLRIIVDEHFGRGTLFIVLQGYKISGTWPSGGRR